MQHIFASEPYRRLVELTRKKDHVGIHQLIESTLAETQGRDHGFWLLVRSGTMIGLPSPPVASVMTDIRAALATAPDDAELEEVVLLHVLALAVMAERVEDAPRWVGMLHRVMRQAREPFLHWYNLGTIQWRRMHPRAAVRNYSRALTGMYAWPEERKLANTGRFFTGHCCRALVAVEAGLLELAERDVAEAERILPTSVMAEDIFLCLAQSALALAGGEIGLARQRLQWVRVQDRARKYLRCSLFIRAEVEVQAARIALAEGNLKAFDHFTGQALAIARENRMPLTARRVERIRLRALGEDTALRI